MNYKLKKIFTNVRVIILLILLVLAVVAINPKPWIKGVAINNVETNSSAAEAGIQKPAPSVKPVNRERLLAIDNKPIGNIEEYYNYVNALEPNQSVQIKTTKGLYRLRAKEDGIGLKVSDAQKTNIKRGLDLQGGTRVLLQPEKAMQKEDLQSLMDTMQERLNVYGLSDLIIRESNDLTGNQYILVEIAGANEDDIRNLLEKQGKFEAKIANQTIFVGGKDIVFVCRSANCAGLDPNYGCSASGGQNICRFRFSISITPEAAKKQANATSNLEVIGDKASSSELYLSEPLELYLDDTKVDELSIGAELKGSTTTDIQISGSGVGLIQQEAVLNTFSNMKRLQTVLITGSLPIKLNIVKIDNISPLLGKEFLSNALLLGALALISIVVVIFARYRRLTIAIPMIFISVSEVILLLAIAALINWNMDLAAVAGIIIAIGTGVNDQIVITDETLRGKIVVYDWKQRIKNAFFIIMAAYFTIVVAMVPLLFAGAGLLKGFAITTIIGASIGVFITRPVFVRVIEILLRE